MRLASLGGLGSAFAWFALPLAPTLLGVAYHRQFHWGFGRQPDPRDWGWLAWVVLTGPLVGYGFLAGATIDLPDDPGRRGPKRWLPGRSAWVAVGPWVGFLAAAAALHAARLVEWAYPPSRGWSLPEAPAWWTPALQWLAFCLVAIGPIAYGWLVVAAAAVRRARRLGRLRRSLLKGLAVAFGFVGSLFGSFWAITEGWRGYFFDPRIAPAIVAASALVLLAGCGTTETLGEVRRRELFDAMLVSWLLGLALAWRWWSRSGRRPPGPPA